MNTNSMGTWHRQSIIVRVIIVKVNGSTLASPATFKTFAADRSTWMEHPVEANKSFQ